MKRGVIFADVPVCRSQAMALESALFFETVEEIYRRVLKDLRPRSPLPEITVQFRHYANANSRIRYAEGCLVVDISDLLEHAPAPVQEALASILLSKLYRKPIDPACAALYRRYLNRADVRTSLLQLKQQRGRKTIRAAKGSQYDLEEIFEELNFKYFGGLLARPQLGWSVRVSRTTLGHYDPSHHVIVLSRLLDTAAAPRLIVEYVMFHEMLHLKYPTEHRGARRCVHTPAFKAAERTFQQYREARTEIRSFLAKKRLADG